MGVSLYLVFYNRVLRPTTRFRLIFLVSLFLVYLFGGSYLFTVINSPPDIDEQLDLIKFKKKFLSEHQCITFDEMQNFIDVLITSADNGIVFTKNSTDFTENWSLGGETLFFTFTLLSTIGYGHIAPLTQYGKIFCIFYIIIGVPLTLVLLNLIVERLVNRIYSKHDLHKDAAHLHERKKPINQNYSTLEQAAHNHKIYVSHKQLYCSTFIVGLVLLNFVYIIPSLVFSKVTEKSWSFVDAIYYCFISITTIGFGDLVPGSDQVGTERNTYRLLMTLYLLFGIILNMLFLNIFIKLPFVNKIFYLLDKKSATYEILVEDDNDQNAIEAQQAMTTSTSSSSSSAASELLDNNIDSINRVDDPVVGDAIINVDRAKKKTSNTQHSKKPKLV